MLDTIMGYYVTDAPDVLEGFLIQGRERYTAIEQALEPIKATVADLEGDWKPRWASYWQAKTADLTTLRTATQAALQLFDREQSSQAAPTPIIFSATSIAYKFGLHTIQSKIEEAGILLTTYIEVSASRQEKHIRQRQRVLKALQDVVKATREAVSEGRTTLNQASQEQQKLLAPRRKRQLQGEETPMVPSTDEAETAERLTGLKVVGGSRTEEGA